MSGEKALSKKQVSAKTFQPGNGLRPCLRKEMRGSFAASLHLFCFFECECMSLVRPTINPAHFKSQYIYLHPIFWDSPYKTRAMFSRHIHRNRQHGPIQRMAQRTCRAGDVQGFQVRTAEHATGGTADRQFDDPIDLTVRAQPEQTVAVPTGIPDKTFGIHRRTVRAAPPMRAKPDLRRIEGSVGTDEMSIQGAIKAVAE